MVGTNPESTVAKVGFASKRGPAWTRSVGTRLLERARAGLELAERSDQSVDVGAVVMERR
jgi:hypothetical protein